MKFATSKIALLLFGLVLARSILILLIVPAGYGADGGGYLAYIEAVKHPHDTDLLWYIRGTTPIYPFFAYSTYLLGLVSGYGIVAAQILLGAMSATAIYLALRPMSEYGALLSGVLLAIDPQVGHVLQLVSTEGLYIPLLTLSMAAFWWGIQKNWGMGRLFALGGLLGIASLVRPVGMLLIVPYLFFYFAIQRSWKGTLGLGSGYVAVVLILCLFNSWRFDFFNVNNTSGLYLGTRLWGVGGLYHRDNGPHSERLYQMLLDCGFEYQESDDESERLQWTQTIRACMYFDNSMPLEDISTFYQQIYAETLRARPIESLKVMLHQLAKYTITASDGYDLESARDVEPSCDDREQDWFAASQLFCPKSPTPLSTLDSVMFGGLLVFNLFTHFPNFLLGALTFPRSTSQVRWLLLFCLAFYAYHAVVTANAGTLLSRYVIVTNPYMLVTLGFVVASLVQQLTASRISLPLEHSTENL